MRQKHRSSRRRVHFSPKHLLPGVFFAMTVLVFAPLELYLSNINEFWFRFNSMLPALLIGCAVCVLVSFLCLALLPRKKARVLEALIYAVTILLYIQGNYLTIDHGTLNGAEIDWGAYMGRYLLDGAIWVVVIVACVLLVVKFRERLLSVLRVAAAVIMITQVVTLVFMGISSANKSSDRSEAYLSKAGEFTVSSGQNTIVLLLDAFDAQLMMNLYEQQPDVVRETFQDFTFYRDTVGGATRTKYAIPYIFAGITNTEEISYPEYVQRAYAGSPFIRELRSGDYDARIYTNKILVSADQSDVIDNLSTGISEVSSGWGLAADYMRLVGFRYAPNVFERFFWMYSGDFEKWKAGGDSGEFAISDVTFFKELNEQGLSLSTDKGCFRFYHLSGAHEPYNMDENCVRVSVEEGTETGQVLGCFNIVRTYIRQLKELGVYDKATIIVMADHGFGKYSVVEQNPILLVKTPGQTGEFEISDLPLSYASMGEIFSAGLRGELNDMDAYAWQGVRHFYKETEDGITINITEYAVEGKAWDNDNVQKTGTVYHGDSLNLSHDYTLGDEVSFAAADTARNYIVSGFSTNEGTHTWTVGNTAVLAFDLKDAQDTDLLVKIKLYTVYNAPQNVQIYAGDKLVSKFVLGKKEQIKPFGIPAEYVKDGHLELKFVMPDAVSPRSLGISSDSRNLALGFKTLVITANDEKVDINSQIDAEKPDDEEITVFQDYKLGTQIQMCGDEADASFTVYGFSGIEANYRWTKGKVSRIPLKISEPHEDLEFSMQYKTFNGIQLLLLYANDTLVFNGELTGGTLDMVQIPADCVQDGNLELRFVLPSAISPKELGRSNDGRELAISMESFTVSSMPAG